MSHKLANISVNKLKPSQIEREREAGMGNGERESKLINYFRVKFLKKYVMHVRVWELSRVIKQICEYLKPC